MSSSWPPQLKLKQQATRTHIATPTNHSALTSYASSPSHTPTGGYLNSNGQGSGYTNTYATSHTTAHTTTPNKKNKKNNKRKQNGGNEQSGPHYTPDADADLGSRIAGIGPLPSQVGRKKLKGKVGFGYTEPEPEVDPNVINWDKYTIKGTSTKLEKSYLRLTSEPSPADIRPLPVLKQTLQLLKQKWKQNHNYAYALDQFKSMRQDLTKDLGEYNQCQSMLRQLYELGISGHPKEFLSYRIMYLLHTKNMSDMTSLLAALTPEEKEDPGVHHALQVHAALVTSNYVRFFRLFLEAPNMSGYIMDHFVERERAQALAIMSKAYMTLPLPYLTKTLAFEDDEETDQFLSAHNAAVYTNTRDPKDPWKPIALSERVWDCKKAHGACVHATQQYRVVDLKGQVD
ncbi:SAC3/GANP domain protein associated with nuclear localization of protein [Trichosporon asahii var. asahii CBS 2479]|uniref:SAC3/GANP domain protein associated with nuclear localization of protein n=1 Tax=Trichosporon asahii var. asahii (strain ATCC 90039 / CBS 2479 / JCM 2466 / KCTC 7840 / NBRC 103889/ NCYC 2677 / UAMH 7654) TaxID=1186058 RepID=J5QJ10_TRIAS|nr:SAC3/GANP domain protein associated with nuclear localization of protein [Trichosporon asahii var. asahii CBS 2479]EJT47588.1 SAC3/GANP domain protein associated with nuclear localization of protein [Trichosporon asahii var. asahii CBS 2479]